jgi:glyoxylase-like metal-dependent hydrolase (beta-lactamase superfamily II)
VTALVRADNPGPMTLEGTNTWLVGERRVLLVDPGPAYEAHVRAVLDRLGDAELGGVLLTHRHHDHADALQVPALADALRSAGAPVLALDPALGRRPDDDALAASTDVPCRVLPVPGHTDDSLALVLPGEGAVLTGDTVLGRGTTVVAHPDGHLGAYLASLEALSAVTDEPRGEPWVGLPGHGPVLADLAGTVRELRAHRLQRVEQVREALDRLGAAPAADAPDEVVEAVVARVYPELVDDVLRWAAGRTVRATLVHLDERAPT